MIKMWGMINLWIALNFKWIVVSALSLSVVVELFAIYYSTGFASVKKVYDYIAGQYYRFMNYVNVFEIEGKFSIGRLLFGISSIIAFRWWWNYKSVGWEFLVFLIFLGGYVLFNKPLLVTAMAAKMQSFISNVGGSSGGSDTPKDPDDV